MTDKKGWARVARALGAPESMTDKSTVTRKIYQLSLGDFEEVKSCYHADYFTVLCSSSTLERRPTVCCCSTQAPMQPPRVYSPTACCGGPTCITSGTNCYLQETRQGRTGIPLPERRAPTTTPPPRSRQRNRSSRRASPTRKRQRASGRAAERRVVGWVQACTQSLSLDVCRLDVMEKPELC